MIPARIADVDTSPAELEAAARAPWLRSWLPAWWADRAGAAYGWLLDCEALEGEPAPGFPFGLAELEAAELAALGLRALGLDTLRQVEEVLCEEVCRGCGCTDLRPCETRKGPCYWTEEGLCSQCWSEARPELEP